MLCITKFYIINLYITNSYIIDLKRFLNVVRSYPTNYNNLKLIIMITGLIKMWPQLDMHDQDT